MRFLPLWFLTALILGAETHQVVPTTYYRTFAHTNAVFKRIQSGDALVVKLTKVRLNRNWGWSGYRLGLFSVMQPDQLRAALARLEPLGASQADTSSPAA